MRDDSKVEFPNKGIVQVDGEEKPVIVKNGIPGQKIRFCVNKLRKGKAEGRLLEVMEKSALETREPVCSIFPACGGCMYQTMDYQAQVKMKAEQIQSIMDAAVDGYSYTFEGVKETLAMIHEKADIVVVSSANAQAVAEEWQTHGLAGHTD